MANGMGPFFRHSWTTIDMCWYRLKFDDDRVTPVTTKEVYEDNFGGEYGGGGGGTTGTHPTPTLPAPNAPPPALKPGMTNQMMKLKRFTNAYMLVYIRESDLSWVQRPVTDADIPEYLRRFNAHMMVWCIRHVICLIPCYCFL